MATLTHNHHDERLTWGCDACTEKARAVRREERLIAAMEDAKEIDVTFTYTVAFGVFHGKHATRMAVPSGWDRDEFMAHFEGTPAADELASRLIEDAIDAFSGDQADLVEWDVTF